MRPIQAQYSHIHRALGGEMLKVEAQAQDLDPRSPESVGALVGHLGMIRMILDIHAREEDNNVYPMIEERLPGITATFTLDHEHERELFAAIDEDIAALQSGSAPDPEATGRHLYRNIVAVTSHLIAHMDKEEAYPYTKFTELLSDEEEMVIVGEVLNSIPDQALAMGMPWQAGFLSDEEVLGNIDLYLKVLGPEKQRAFIGPLANGLPPERWQSFVQQKPELAAFQS
jgi:hypothetical protein